ncbi:MAG TPA: hypothetical protein DCY35_05210 [Prolixibacteraceae bacterium]|nr:hypothetical protein [Prolixibacteraceae bacterium]
MNFNKAAFFQKAGSHLTVFAGVLLFISLGMAKPASAHCDSYDGPVITDARKAIDAQDPALVLKWVSASQESEILPLFNKVVDLKSGDQEIFQIVEKHFLETLVRLHRETEGAPYTGLKPAGTTKPIVQLSDQALDTKDTDGLLKKLNNRIGQVVREKYEAAVALARTKDDNAEAGRAWVKAYVDYTHTLEALHDVLEHDHAAHAH